MRMPCPPASSTTPSLPCACQIRRYHDMRVPHPPATPTMPSLACQPDLAVSNGSNDAIAQCYWHLLVVE